MTEQNLMDFLSTLRTQIKDDHQETLKQAEENITRKINENFNEKFKIVEQEIKQIKETQAEQENRLELFDKMLRQRNLIIFGIIENEKSYSDLEDKILQIMTEKLEIDLERKEIEFAGRMGKKENKPRPIRLTLTTLGKKILILKRKKALDGSGSYIKEDYSPKVLETRKGLQLQLQEKRENGISAFLVYDKIVIKGKPSYKRALSSSPQNKTPTKNKTAHINQTSKRTKTSGSVPKSRPNKLPQGNSSRAITAYITRTPQGDNHENAMNTEVQ